MNAKNIPTGNQMISLPNIDEATAGIYDFTFLHMGYKGLIDVIGDKTTPLMKPFIEIDNKKVAFKSLIWKRLSDWIPNFTLETDTIKLSATILAPINERGFLVNLRMTNCSNNTLKVNYGLSGRWASSLHCINEDKVIQSKKYCYESPWNDSIVFDMRGPMPIFSFAPITDKKCIAKFSDSDGSVDYSLTRFEELKPGENCELTVYWGVGFEEVAAATSAKEMLRQGYENELAKTLDWLNERSLTLRDKNLTRLYNTNLFFCIFFSTGVTLDTEEFVSVTSRSPRYYVSAAYWDRDSLLWSFPAILNADKNLARDMLMYVYDKQRKNFGVHSRYIDGTVLEPGFELDELMAPVIALERYVDTTDDISILEEKNIKKGIEEILNKLKNHRHKDVALYETFLQPTDDMHVYRYITYDNMLVWKALLAISRLYPKYRNLEFIAGEVKEAILKHCVKEENGKRCFAWSVDLQGHYDIYDEPPGSLQLFPYYGFCKADDEIYKNTVNIIRSPEYKYSFADSRFSEIGCPHAPHPWILSVANSLLCGRSKHCYDFLKNVKMDNYIACESVDEYTGECTTGAAFATCAGLLCHSIKEAKEGLDKIYE